MEKKKHLLVKPSHNLMFAGKFVGYVEDGGSNKAIATRQQQGTMDTTLNWSSNKLLKFTINRSALVPGAGQSCRVQVRVAYGAPPL